LGKKKKKPFLPLQGYRDGCMSRFPKSADLHPNLVSNVCLCAKKNANNDFNFKKPSKKSIKTRKNLALGKRNLQTNPKRGVSTRDGTSRRGKTPTIIGGKRAPFP